MPKNPLYRQLRIHQKTKSTEQKKERRVWVKGEKHSCTTEKQKFSPMHFNSNVLTFDNVKINQQTEPFAICYRFSGLKYLLRKLGKCFLCLMGGNISKKSRKQKNCFHCKQSHNIGLRVNRVENCYNNSKKITLLT